MAKIDSVKYIALASVVTAILGVSPAYAATACPGLLPSWGIGRVSSVIQDSTAFAGVSSSPLIGIEISYDSVSTKKYFTTYLSMDVQGHNRARTLLQLANLAYTTQAPVVPTTGASSCAETITLGGKNWITQLQGLVIGNYAKP